RQIATECDIRYRHTRSGMSSSPSCAGRLGDSPTVRRWRFTYRQGGTTVAELDTVLWSDEAASITATAGRNLGVGRASRELRISSGDLGLLIDRKIDEAGLGDTLVSRVFGWARANPELLFETNGGPTPTYNHFVDYWDNFYAGPRGPRPPLLDRPGGRRRFLD